MTVVPGLDANVSWRPSMHTWPSLSSISPYQEEGYTDQERKEIRARTVLKNDVWQVLAGLAKTSWKWAFLVVNSVDLLRQALSVPNPRFASPRPVGKLTFMMFG
jgi:hypothetical protein